MIVSHKIVHENKFKIISDDKETIVKIKLNKNNIALTKIFKEWIIKNGYDYKKNKNYLWINLSKYLFFTPLSLLNFFILSWKISYL